MLFAHKLLTNAHCANMTGLCPYMARGMCIEHDMSKQHTCNPLIGGLAALLSLQSLVGVFFCTAHQHEPCRGPILPWPTCCVVGCLAGGPGPYWGFCSPFLSPKLHAMGLRWRGLCGTRIRELLCGPSPHCTLHSWPLSVAHPQTLWSMLSNVPQRSKPEPNTTRS
jgi:hypothetical protein